MKGMILLAVLGLVSLTAFARSSRGTVSPSAPEMTIRVLVVGFDDTQLNSNYFLKCEIAERTMLPADSVSYHFNRKLIDQLQSNSNGKLDIIPINDSRFLAQFYRNVNYIESGDRVRSEFHKESSMAIQETVDTYNADYILFLNSYQLRWQGNPFNTLFHILSYDIFDSSLENVYNGVSSFNHAELSPLSDVERKMSRQAGKIMNQVARSAK